MIKLILMDLDGTVYYGSQRVPGADTFVATMRRQGRRCFFVTNRSNRLPATVVRHLEEMGIPCTPQDILTASQATAQYLRQGSFFCIGEEGLTQPLLDAGLVPDNQSPDYVVVGFDRAFNYEKLKQACRLILKGAKFIATNPDVGLPTEKGISPGTGAIIAAVQAATGIQPTVIGKPERLIFDIALRQLECRAEDTIAVGDNLKTDIPAGITAGIRTALLLTGVSKREDVVPNGPQPTWIVKDYADLTRIVEAESPA